MELTNLPTEQAYKGFGIVHYRPDVDEDIQWAVVLEGKILVEGLVSEDAAYAYVNGWLDRLDALNRVLQVQSECFREDSHAI